MIISNNDSYAQFPIVFFITILPFVYFLSIKIDTKYLNKINFNSIMKTLSHKVEIIEMINDVEIRLEHR